MKNPSRTWGPFLPVTCNLLLGRYMLWLQVYACMPLQGPQVFRDKSQQAGKQRRSDKSRYSDFWCSSSLPLQSKQRSVSFTDSLWRWVHLLMEILRERTKWPFWHKWGLWAPRYSILSLLLPPKNKQPSDSKLKRQWKDLPKVALFHLWICLPEIVCSGPGFPALWHNIR